MGPFLVQAGLEGRVGPALLSAGISASEYRRARADDPAFDAACVDLEILRRAQIVSNVEDLAAGGNIAAVRLVAKGLGELRPHASGIEPEIPPHVQAAMLDAGMKAADKGESYPDGTAHHFDCPHCGRYVRVTVTGSYSAPFFEVSGVGS